MLTIPVEKLAFIIEKAREFDAESAPGLAARRRGPEWLGSPWGHPRLRDGDGTWPRDGVAHATGARGEAARGVKERTRGWEARTRPRRDPAGAVWMS